MEMERNRQREGYVSNGPRDLHGINGNEKGEKATRSDNEYNGDWGKNTEAQGGKNQNLMTR